MGLDVVRVPVAADLVVRDQHLRPALPDQRHDFVAHRQQVRGPERVLPKLVARDCISPLVVRHARVPKAAVASEPYEVGDAEDVHACWLAEPVLADIVRRSAARWLRSSTSTAARVQVTGQTSARSATYFAIVTPLLIVSSSGARDEHQPAIRSPQRRGGEALTRPPYVFWEAAEPVFQALESRAAVLKRSEQMRFPLRATTKCGLRARSRDAERRRRARRRLHDPARLGEVAGRLVLGGSVGA